MNQTAPIRLGTRGSALAMWQAETVRDLLSREAPMRDVEIIEVKTLGDRVQDRKIEEIGRTAVFTAELDRALLDKSIDLAVHSLKDVETTMPDGIEVAAVLPRGPVEDALVSESTLDRLPKGAKVGTGSIRRVAQLRRLRPDLVIEGIRGNVPTRIEKLDRGEYDALVMARAGLVRLGLGHRIASVFTPDQMMPAVGQGAIAITCLGQVEAMMRICGGIDHAPTARIVRIERACLRDLGGGCNIPLGISCTFEDDGLRFRGGVFAVVGPEAAQVDIGFSTDLDPEEAGVSAASALREAGADRILAAILADREGDS